MFIPNRNHQEIETRFCAQSEQSIDPMVALQSPERALYIPALFSQRVLFGWLDVCLRRLYDSQHHIQRLVALWSVDQDVDQTHSHRHFPVTEGMRFTRRLQQPFGSLRRLDSFLSVSHTPGVEDFQSHPPLWHHNWQMESSCSQFLLPGNCWSFSEYCWAPYDSVWRPSECGQ